MNPLRRPFPAPAATLALALALGLGLAACGGDDLVAATEELQEMQQQVDRARARVDTHEAEARDAEAALTAARKELDEAEKRLAAARAQLAKQANDAVLFRAVQQRLLDEGKLAGVAISARVQKRVVTLEGSVPSEELKNVAEKVAAETPGVETVVNQVTVRATSAP